MISHPELVSMLDAIGQKFTREGDYRVRPYFPGDDPFFVRTFSSPGAFVVLRATEMHGGPPRTFIEIGGGGAHSAKPDGRLFQHLLTRCLDFDWGGPFARLVHDGTVTYGLRLTLPSDILSLQSNSFAFIMGMIDGLGGVARLLAEELVPQFGGTNFIGTENDDVRLIAALFGPPPAT